MKTISILLLLGLNIDGQPKGPPCFMFQEKVSGTISVYVAGALFASKELKRRDTPIFILNELDRKFLFNRDVEVHLWLSKGGHFVGNFHLKSGQTSLTFELQKQNAVPTR